MKFFLDIPPGTGKEIPPSTPRTNSFESAILLPGSCPAGPTAAGGAGFRIHATQSVSPPRLSARRAAAGLLCAFLLAPFAALFAAPAQAQTVETLVSNFDQSISPGSRTARALRFRTGSNDIGGVGFTLSDVVLQLSITTNFNSSLSYVTLNEDDSGDIGALVATLNTPSVANFGNNIFTAPEGTTLAENTNYFVVVNAGLNESQLAYFDRTTDNGEDSNSRAGWSIFNSGRYIETGSNAWSTSLWKIAIDIRGYANAALEPEISVLGLNDVEIPSGASTPSAQTGTNFGSVGLLDGTGSNVFVDRTFTIGNSGTGALTLGADAVSLVDAPPGSRPGVFSVVTQPAETVAAGGSTTFTIRFDPASAGVESLWVSVANDDADEAPYRFRIGGNGVAAQLGLSWSGGNLLTGDRTVSFGEVALAGGMAQETFTVINTGAGALHLGSNAVTLSGAAAAEFSVAAQPAETVAAGESTTFVIKFDPDVEGLREAVATLAVVNDLNHRPSVEFNLQGRAALPEITIASDGDVTEGSPAAFTLTRTGDPADALTVAVEVSESGDVVAAEDEGSATATFAAGSSMASFGVATENDAVEEADSVVTVEIAADTADPPAWVPGSPGEAEVTVADDDEDATPATLTVADARALEGEAVAFAVTLSREVSDPVTVQYDTSSGTLDTGTATAGTDYVAARGGTLTIPAGFVAGVVSVTTLGDAAGEDDETFTLTLSNPSSNAELGAPSLATGTIVDDDRPDAGAVPGGAISLAGARLGTQVRDASIDVCWEPGVAVPGDAIIELRSRRFWIYPEPFLPWKEAARGDSYSSCGEDGVLVTRDRLWRGLALTLEVRMRRDAEVLAISPQLRAQVPNHDDAELHAHLSAPLDDEGRGLDTPAGPFVLELYFTDPTLYVYTTEAVSGLEAADFAVTNGAASVEVWNVMTYKVTVTPAELGEPVSVRLPANAVLGVGESLTANGGNTYTRPNAASNTVTVDTAASEKQTRAQSPRDEGTALTASFTDVPAEHDGSSEFTVRLAFSEEPQLDFRTLRDRAVTVDGGTVRRVGRVAKGRNDRWEIRVRPDGNGAVTVALEATAPCGEAGAVCTADGKALANAPRVVVAGPPALSVADAEAHEGPGAALAFAVTLSRAVSGTVTVNYATADGTAMAGADYTATSGVLNFAAGETARTVSVPILEDSHDDDGETLTLRLSNPSGAYLADGAATGTIHNSDPMPGAWLSRFGRAASDRALDAIGRRFAGEDSQSHLTLGGGGFGRLRALGRQSQDSQGTPMSVNIQHGTPMSAISQAQSQGTPMPTQQGTPMSGSMTAAGTGGGTDAFARFLGVPRFGDLLRDASFFYRPDEEARKSIPAWLSDWSAWGETGASRFRGAEGSLEIDGELRTATAGFDTRGGRWFGGLALAHARGAGGYARGGSEGGEIASTLTSLYPYARYEFNDRTSVWAALGFGMGDLSLTPERAEADQDTLHTGLGHTSVAFGGRAALSGQVGETGGFELALRSDARWNRTVSDTVTGMMGASGETGRVRLLLEGSGSLDLAGGVLSPTLEAGLRYDAGDAETGAGVEVGGGLAYRTGQLTLQLNARGLAAHERKDYDEWGYSTSISWQPGEDGLGPRFTLGSSMGATQSGVRQLWTRETASGLARRGTNDGQRFEAEFGWGFEGRGGKDRWEPFLGLQGAGSGDSSMRLGLNLSSGANFNLDFEFGWRETHAEEGDYAAGLQGRFSW